MAIYSIVQATPIYYEIEVSFLDCVFRQILATVKTGTDLQKQLQEYSDAYERDWISLQSA